MSRAYPERPLVGVGVVVCKGDQVLLVRRAKAPRRGQWSLPGGAQKLGETVRQAAIREVREETGLEVALTKLLDAVDSISRDEAGRVQYHYTLVDFAAEWRAGEPTPGGDAAEARWVARGDLDRYELWEETVRIIGLSAER